MKRTITVGLVAVVQLILVGVGVAPQLSARAFGEEYRLRVAPFDPIDPFRGAYVDLTYPDVQTNETGGGHGTIFLPLRQDGEVWVADGQTRTRPEQGPYLACHEDGWRVQCGIESWFLPQDEAGAMELDVADGAIATVKIDSRGHAALVGLE